MSSFFFAAFATLALAAARPPVEVELKDGAGKVLGHARITEAKKGVTVHLEVEGLAPGEHAVHFHEKGVCTGPAFTSAGGHFNPEGKEHGKDTPKGPHAGDMANFSVGANGKASVDVQDEHVTLDQKPTSLLHTGGSALVIHAKPDDYKSQPAGNAGDRAVCGEIHGG